jgi:hypothetical protein
VLASCLGWALNLFNLFVLLYVAPVVGRLFFPSGYAMLSHGSVVESRLRDRRDDADALRQTPSVCLRAF